MEALIQSGYQNVTKNKLSKRVNSTKIYFSFASINLKKAPEKCMFYE